MKEKGILAVISGFSGAGKGTLMKILTERCPDYALSVSVTTRSPREGEVEGVSYFFLSDEKFREMIEEDGLYEYARYGDHYYGTPRSFVDQALAEGRDVLLEIDVQGGEKIRETFPDAVRIFVSTPTVAELKRRLIGRHTESEESIALRLGRAVSEAAFMENYDYVVINDDLESCVDEIHSIITAEHARTGRRCAFIQEINSEFGRKEK